MNLVLNPKSEKLVRRLGEHLPQSLLISGDAGVGLKSIARTIGNGSIIALIEPTDAKDKVDHARGSISV